MTTQCRFTPTGTPGVYHCPRCGYTTPPVKFPPEAVHRECPAAAAPIETSGPGAELMAILKSLAITEQAGCDCLAKARQMDAWGVAGCRENFNTIIGWMRDGQGRWGWGEKFKAAALAAATGLAFKINWADPFPGLIEEAIRRAEAKSQAAAPAVNLESGTRGPESSSRFPAIEKRNLIFYILPLRHSLKVWQWHVEQLRKYLPLFNGRRIITIATPGENNRLAIEPAALVRAAFGEDAGSIEFLERPNDPEFWEAPAFREMLAMIAESSKFQVPDSKPQASEHLEPGTPNLEGVPEATFYFHAKGVRRANQEAIRLWCQEIYRHNLGRIGAAMAALENAKACGIAKSPTNPGGIDTAGGWHFAGTGFWFRHDALFGGERWNTIHDHSHAVEAYLGTQFAPWEVACLAYDNIGAVYSAATWQAAIAAFDAAAAAADKRPPESVRVSLLVVGRNYGRYLRECLESCAWQTHKPHEIMYVDDASDDDSVAIASDLWTSGRLRPFRVVGLEKRVGVAAARNHAASLATGNALVFIDADDVLPADYLARSIARLGVSTPFVYSDLQCFGRENRLVRMPEWGVADLRKQNFCHSSSLIWREAFDAAGGWAEGDFAHMPDWQLFLRLATLGEPRRADVALGYRKHGQSWTDLTLAADPQAIESARRRILASVDAWAAERKVSSSKFHVPSEERGDASG